MNSKKVRLTSIALLLCLLLVSLAVVGCKCPFKKSDKAAMTGAEQTVCPVSGKPIDKQYSTVYKGKTVYFCCPKCKPMFEKEPEKYTDKLP